MFRLSVLVLIMHAAFWVKAQTPDFKIQVIDNQISIGYGLVIGDVDGDKKPDILLADQKEFVWYRNPGNKTDVWKRNVMARNLTPQDNVCIAARDLDGDGRVEVAVGAGWNPAETSDSTKSGAVFYLIRPKDPTQLWDPVRLPAEVTTHRMRWAKVAPNQYQLIVVPLHGFQNKNGEGRGVRVYGYELPKNIRGGWKRHLVDSTLHMTHNFEIWEEGPATGVIIGGKEGGKILEWRGGRWQYQPEEAARLALDMLTANGAGIGEIRRLNGGREVATIQPMHGNLLQIETGYYSVKNPRKDVSDKEISILTDEMSQGHALATGDFLKMGQDQIAVGWRNPNKEKLVGVRLFVPQKDGRWEENTLDESVRMACEDLQAADLDLDGDLDLIASGRATLNVLVYWNQKN